MARRWLRICLAVAVGAALSAAPAPAQTVPLADRSTFVDGLSALREGRADLAAERFDQLLGSAENLSSEDAETLRLLRLEAFVRSRAAAAAIAAVDDASFPESPRRDFWHGLALAQAKRYPEAIARLGPLASLPPEIQPHPVELSLNLAICQHQTGDSDAALATLEPLRKSDGRSRADLLSARIQMSRGRPVDAAHLTGYDAGPNPVDPATGSDLAAHSGVLRGRLALAEGRFDEAETLFRKVIATAPTDPASDRARLGLVEISLASEKPRQAANLLMEFIDARPASPWLGAAFRRLNNLRSLHSIAILRRLETWATGDTDPRRRAFAQFHLAVTQRDLGNTDAALANLGSFLAGSPRHPLEESARLQLADSLIETGRFAEASAEIAILQDLAVLPATRSRLPLVAARLARAEGRPEDALATYLQTIELATDGPTRETAAFNGALLAIERGDEATYDKFSGQLPEESEIAGDLLIQRGLFEARSGEPGAFETLEEFVRRFDSHPQRADAQIALAELYLNQVPAQAVTAREHLDSARENSLTLGQREWLDHVGIWVEVAAQQNAQAVERARDFLADWPQSARRPAVFMLLGESHYKMGSFTDAADYLEAMATESPESPLAESALFFAARAASQSMDPTGQERSVALWERVAEAGGSLALAARHELGLLRLSREDFETALADFDAVIASGHTDPSLAIAAMADKGETLFIQASLSEADAAPLFRQAADAFAAVGQSEAAPKAWRLQAVVRQGKCLEALGETDAALGIYTDLVDRGAPAGPVAAVPMAEYDWHYRAGLAAIRLLQAAGNQEAAVAVADAVAQTGGPRAAEAARIADRLRLRHFIWQDPTR